MTREEAIKILQGERWYMSRYSEEYKEAYDTAIEALQAKADSDDLIIKGAKGIKDGLYNIKDGKMFKYYAKGGIVQAYEIVPSAEAVQGEWIPVSERLPEDNELMLVNYIDRRESAVDTWIGWHEMDNVWYIDGEAHGKEFGNEVIAWMPLPEPYKGGEEYEKYVEQMEHDIMYEPTYNQDDGSM